MNRLTAILVAAALALAVGCKKEEKTTAPAKDPKAAPTQTAPVEGEIKGRRVDVAVKKTGYEPASVDVKTNEEVTLVFTMLEETECGSEVAIPSQNVVKKLELGKPVAIAFKADQPGEVKFTCGMNMMQGKIVVN